MDIYSSQYPEEGFMYKLNTKINDKEVFEEKAYDGNINEILEGLKSIIDSYLI